MTAIEPTTPVLFRKHEGEVIAVFPAEPATLGPYNDMTCYAHVGQHGACSQDWYNATKAAKPHEYAALKAELEAEPHNYRLKVYQRMQPAHRRARAAEQSRLRKLRAEP